MLRIRKEKLPKRWKPNRKEEEVQELWDALATPNSTEEEPTSEVIKGVGMESTEIEASDIEGIAIEASDIEGTEVKDTEIEEIEETKSVENSHKVPKKWSAVMARLNKRKPTVTKSERKKVTVKKLL